MTEKAFKTAIRKTTQRKRAFKRLTAAQQDAAAAELLGERGDSAAAFFDLMGLRRTGSNRVTQVGFFEGYRVSNPAVSVLWGGNEPLQEQVDIRPVGLGLQACPAMLDVLHSRTAQSLQTDCRKSSCFPVAHHCLTVHMYCVWHPPHC